ncbi:MAG: general stress protein [Acidimicrobiales bacterium]
MEQPPDIVPGVVPVQLATYDEYKEAQQAVDHLSDEGFPVGTLTIVWSGLRQIEHVTGRRTVFSAASEGALSGMWFGLLIGLVFSAFAAEGESEIGIIITYAVVGALGVAAWRAIGHFGLRGTRDFSSTRKIDAEEYQVWVAPDRLTEAAGILGVAPPPAAGPAEAAGAAEASPD